MHGHQGKITADAIKSVEIVRKIELEEISAEVTVGQPFKIDLRWGDNKPTEDYYGNQDSQGSLLSKPTGSSDFQGIKNGRSGEDKEDWHHPDVTELDKNICPEAGLGIINMPRVRVKKPAIME